MASLNKLNEAWLSKIRTGVILFSVFLAFTNLANAQTDLNPTFGAEFTLTNFDVAAVPFGPNRIVLDKMRAMHEEMCKSAGCIVVDALDAYRVEFKDGFWLHVGVDQHCLEVNTKPSTSSEYHLNSRNVQWFIFNVGERLGVFPHEKTGQGHIHMSMKAFGFGTPNEDVKLFRNFLVDRFNHPELDLAFSRDFYNSAPLAALSDEQILAAEEVIRKIDAGELKTIKEIAMAVENQVYKIGKHPLNWAPLEKYQAINLVRIVNKKKKFDIDDITVEFRSIAAQRNSKEFILQTEFLKRRIAWLSQQKLIPFDGLKVKQRVGELEVDKAFKERIKEVGLNYSEYAHLNRFPNLGIPVPSIEDFKSLAKTMGDLKYKVLAPSCKKLGPLLTAFPND